MTYDELGRIRGIGRESAVQLVKRKRWRRVRGNDGGARIFVPGDWLAPAKEASPERSPEHSPEPPPELSRIVSMFDAALTALREAKEGEIATLRDQLGREVERGDRAEASLTAERSRADALRDQLTAAKNRAEKAEEAADTLRRAEAERRARGRLRRLLAAWRGR